MKHVKRTLFEKKDDWEDCFKNHSAQVGVDKLIDKLVDCWESEFKLICKSI